MQQSRSPRTPWLSLAGGCLESRFDLPGHELVRGPMTLHSCAAACEAHRDAYIQSSLVANATTQLYAWRARFDPSAVRKSVSPMGGACGAFSFFDVTASVPEAKRPPPLMQGAEPVLIGFCTLKAYFCTLPPYKIRYGECTADGKWRRRDQSKRGFCTCAQRRASHLHAPCAQLLHYRCADLAVYSTPGLPDPPLTLLAGANAEQGARRNLLDEIGRAHV